jgi:hypothetical protein
MSNYNSLEPTPLVGGISQQQDTLRPSSHVKSASNFLFDLRVARTRQGTMFERKFTAAPNADLGADIWRWSADEKYLVVRGTGNGSPVLRIFRAGGNECAVTISGAASTYLDTSDAGSLEMRFCPQPSYALVVNTKVTVTLTTTPAYSLERHRPTYRDLIAYTTTANNYLQTDADDGSADKGFYKYTPGTYKPSIINFQIITNPWSIHNGYWDDNTYGNNAGFRIAFRRIPLAGFTGAVWDNTAKTLTKSGAFTAYFGNYRNGDMIYVSAIGTAGAGLVGWQRISAATANAVTLPEANATGGTADCDVTDAVYSETNICRIGREIEVVIDFTKAALASMHDVAAKITEAMQAAGADNAACAWIPQAQGGAFQITGPYVGDNAAVYLPTSPTSSVLSANGDLTNDASDPFYRTAGYQFFGGSGGVAPNASDTNAIASRWTRTAAPGQSNGVPDSTTMPVKINRSAANTFDVDVIAWTPRTAGDSSNNKGSSLFRDSQTITDAVTHDERLFLCGGPYLAGSKIGDGFDFFVANPNQVVDSDPISKTVPGRYRGVIRHMVSWNDILVLFHDSAQFEVSASGDQTLTPTSAQLNRSTTYPTGLLRPQASSTQLFFVSVSDTSQHSQLYEYGYNDIRAASEALLVSGHVPTILPPTIRGIASIPAFQSVVMIPSTGTTVYVYRFHYDGADKVQSAWTTLAFDAGYRFVAIASDDDRLWLIIENTAIYTPGTGALSLTITSHGYSDGDPIVFSQSTTTPSVNGTKYVKVTNANTVAIFNDVGLTSATTLTVGGSLRWHTGDYVVETLSLAEAEAPAGFPCPVHMDRQLTLTGTHAAGKTTFTLPSTPATVPPGGGQLNGHGSTLNYVVLGNAFGADAGKVLPITEYGTTFVKVDGNYSAGPVIVGRFFPWSLELPRPLVRNGRGRPDIASRTIACGLTIAHQDTCNYSVQVTHPGCTTRTRAFDSGIVPTSSEFLAMLGGESGKSVWSIVNSSNASATRSASIVWTQWHVERSPIIDAGDNSGS